MNPLSLRGDPSLVLKNFQSSMEENGFAILEDAHTPGELDAIHDQVLRLEAQGNPSHPNFVYSGEHLWAIWNLFEIDAVLMRLVFSPKSLRIIARYTGESMEFCRATLMKKTSGVQHIVDWHQDLSVAVDRDLEDAASSGIRDGVPHRMVGREILEKMVTVRVNIEPQYKDGGALKVIPGSHRWGKLEESELKSRIKEKDELICEVPAGSILCYHPLLAHASGPNTRAFDSKSQRRVLHMEFNPSSMQHPSDGVQWHPWKNRATIHGDGVSLQ